MLNDYPIILGICLIYLENHLKGTFELAAQFAKAFNSERLGQNSWPLLMTTGKSTGKIWQKYLIRKSGYGEDDAHLEGKPRTVEHSTSSAKLAEENFWKRRWKTFSYCIAGHHAGLP